MTQIAVIPARGGSKRIPRKNIRPFCGKPIIAWSIEAALASECFDAVIVSTDDEEIASIALQWGATVPFMRPQSLSDDFTGTAAVIRHAIEWFASQGTSLETACCIYATAPFVTAEDLTRGRDILSSTRADYAISVTSYAFPIQRAVRITPRTRLEMFYPQHAETRSQDLEEAYHDAGQFYWGRTDAWRQGTPLFSEAAAPVLLPRYRVQDIDTLEDWARAEWMFKAMRQDS